MYEHEAAEIRRMMENTPRVIYTDHARTESMVQRRINDTDVRTVLKKCVVTEVRPNLKGDVLSAEGSDLEGRRLRICVALNPPRTIIVITAIDL